ncbi:MAG: iron-containing alcohol dehydrogenase [Nitrososphaerota archaeon]|nr:iron-containing alcohol dehydrogenase [Nitrososphaerota archaeon]MDG6939599.1 iron-containing alcohol dehydrogenase [Nitrososphaerota archaeon]
MDRPGHLMELPQAVYVGDDVLPSLAGLLREQELDGPVCVASGPHVRLALGERLAAGLRPLPASWVEVEAPTEEAVRLVAGAAGKAGARTIVGFGGGKTIDVAKMAAFGLRLPMVSVPTSASHDGISSPFASLRGGSKPYSVKAKPPRLIAVDVKVVMGAPPRLLKGGFGDLVAKLTAVKDWELGKERKGEYFGSYSASLARMSAELVMGRAGEVGSVSVEGTRALIEALISAGVAAGIAGSSRPCSGSEHLVSHALELIAPGAGLHGEKTGISTIAMAKLHGLDWRSVKASLERAGCPSSFDGVGLSVDQVARAVMMAPSIRPDRYTILHELKMGRREVEGLLRETGVVGA